MKSPSMVRIVHKPQTVRFGSFWAAGKLAVLPLVRARRRSLRKTTFVAVTGSAAKTTTVRLIEAVLERRGPVSPIADGRSQGLKVTKAVFRARRGHRSCVYELAAYGPGTLDEILWAYEPDIGVVTTVGVADYARYGSREAIAREKGKLVAALPPSGVAILNADDPLVRGMATLTRAPVVLYGRSPDAAVRAEDVRAAFPEPLSFTLVAEGRRRQVRTRLYGEHWLTACLAAITTGLALGLTLDEAADAVATVEPSPSRMSVLESPRGVTFLRDDFKASACTVPAALETLRSARAGRKVAVLGRMLHREPGPAEDYYVSFARAARRSADLVVLVGEEASLGLRARSSPADGSIRAFASTAEASTFLGKTLRPGDLVLVKSSQRSEHLERISLASVLPVRCWKPACDKHVQCDRCPQLARRSDRKRLTEHGGLARSLGQAVLGGEHRPSWPAAAGSFFWLPPTRLRRRMLRGTTFVAVTGSLGKSTTCHLLEALLAELGPVSPMRLGANQPRKLTKTVFRTWSRHSSCVYELQASGPNTLDEILWACEPDVGVVTTVASDHLSAFRTLEATAREKAKLVASLSESGVAVLNADDPYVRAMAPLARGRVVLFGRADEAELRAEDVRASFPDCLAFTLIAAGARIPVQTRLVGEHWLSVTLAALATAWALGVPLERATRRLAEVEPYRSRLSVLEAPTGVTFLRDDFKGSSWALQPALDTLEAARAARKIAVLGRITDDKRRPRKLYPEAALTTRRVADLVAVVGPDAHHALAARSAENDNSILAFETTPEAMAELSGIFRPGDLVLVKGALKAEHLERISLAQTLEVRCRRARCRKNIRCDECRNLGPRHSSQSTSP
jgi:UDP-N-acetylmuramyl pentapeptide synthase